MKHNKTPRKYCVGLCTCTVAHISVKLQSAKQSRFAFWPNHPIEKNNNSNSNNNKHLILAACRFLPWLC